MINLKVLTYRTICLVIALSFGLNCSLPSGVAWAAVSPETVLDLPVPGEMVTHSPNFTPVLLKGITLHPKNPLEFDFIIDSGSDRSDRQFVTLESSKLIKYFLASLTVPEDQMWVNLSPYENNRIIPDQFGLTEMGRDLLAQDYILKQLTASMIYPEKDLGKMFWNRVYKKLQEQYGTTHLPMNTFNKVWIIPDQASVLEYKSTVFVKESHLKVMLEEDYLSLEKQTGMGSNLPAGRQVIAPTDTHTIGSKIVREIILPEIEKEVNEGKNFSNLRQIYNAMILATWYKIRLKEGLLAKIYVDQNKIKGIDLKDPKIKQKIYEQYLASFKKGVYNFVKEEPDIVTKELVPRKYFSGGFEAENLAMLVQKDLQRLPNDPAMLTTAQAIELRQAAQSKKGRISIVQARFGEYLGEDTPTTNAAMLGNNYGKKLSYDPLKDELYIQEGSNRIQLTLLGRGDFESVFAYRNFAFRILPRQLRAGERLKTELAGFYLTANKGLGPRVLNRDTTSNNFPMVTVELIEGKTLNQLGDEANKKKIVLVLELFKRLLEEKIKMFNAGADQFMVGHRLKDDNGKLLPEEDQGWVVGSSNAELYGGNISDLASHYLGFVESSDMWKESNVKKAVEIYLKQARDSNSIGATNVVVNALEYRLHQIIEPKSILASLDERITQVKTLRASNENNLQNEVAEMKQNLGSIGDFLEEVSDNPVASAIPQFSMSENLLEEIEGMFQDLGENPDKIDDILIKMTTLISLMREALEEFKSRGGIEAGDSAMMADYRTKSQEEARKFNVDLSFDEPLTSVDQSIEEKLVRIILETFASLPQGVLEKSESSIPVRIKRINYQEPTMAITQLGVAGFPVVINLNFFEGEDLTDIYFQEDIRAAISHELLHHLPFKKEKGKNDLIFPVKDLIDFLKANGFIAIKNQDETIPLEEYLSIEKIGLEAVIQRIIRLNKVSIVYAKEGIALNRSVEEFDYLRDPLEFIAYIGEGVGVGTGYTKTLESLEIMERNFLRVGKLGYRRSKATKKFEPLIIEGDRTGYKAEPVPLDVGEKIKINTNQEQTSVLIKLKGSDRVYKIVFERQEEGALLIKDESNGFNLRVKAGLIIPLPEYGLMINNYQDGQSIGIINSSEDRDFDVFLPEDKAMMIVKDKTPGGIDLNARLLKLQIKRDSQGMPLPMSQQSIENLKIDGFVPIIIKIIPVQNLPAYLGLSESSPENLNLAKT